jgi:AraC-like DNA-binding protein
MSTDSTVTPSTAPVILVYAVRERAKAFARSAFPKRKAKTVLVKNREEFNEAIRRELIDAVVVDLGGGGEEAWDILGLSQDFPSTPFFALVQSRATDGPAIARATQMGVADVLTEGIDEDAARDLVGPFTYSTRFTKALQEVPQALGLNSEIQKKTWAALINHAGRPVTTKDLATEIGITREHLSRNFALGNGPNLKRVIDLVRLISAAELSKNPGYDVRDVAAVLGFASSSHLAVTTQRIASTRPASLAGLRAVDLVERFLQGRTRSRVAGTGSL